MPFDDIIASAVGIAPTDAEADSLALSEKDSETDSERNSLADSDADSDKLSDSDAEYDSDSLILSDALSETDSDTDSLSENDSHFIDQIGEQFISTLFVSIYGDPKSDSNQVIIKKALSLKNKRDEKYPLDVNFYDAESAKAWG